MSFGNARVLAFESRRAKEIAELIRLNGGEPFVAPVLKEVPIEANQEAFAFADRLYAGDFDAVVFLTGVGAQYLRRVLATRDPDGRFPGALRRLAIVTRGPKPTAVMRAWDVPVAVTVPEPNTWRELLEAVSALPAERIAVQEYGRSNDELLAGLRRQGRVVTPVPVYQWSLPDDTGPLVEALIALAAGSFEAAIFTTGVQIEHVLSFAEDRGVREQTLEALRRLFIASIGPTCSESLRTSGLTPALEPSHPRMGILVREAAEAFARTVHARAT